MSILCCICVAAMLAPCERATAYRDIQRGPALKTAAAGIRPASSKSRKKKPSAEPPAESKEKVPYGQDPDKYELSFAEEFDRLDRKRWNDHIWYESPNPTKNYAVEDGVLKIWPQRDASGQFFNRTFDTDGKFYQTYGYFEMEAKLPHGRGVWPAFWLFNHIGERRPEIDIMEAYPSGDGWGFMDKAGMHRPNVYASTIWIGDGKQGGFTMFETHKDLSAGFHKYAVKWEPHRQTFYFDGKPTLTVDISMSDPLYIVLDLWFGGAAGTPDDTTPQGKANSFEINYVRAWKFKHGTSERERHGR